MRLEGFDPEADGAQRRACYAMYSAGAPADAPDHPPMTERVFQGWLAHGWTEAPRRAWLATDAGEPLGWYVLTVPDRENRHLAAVDLLVAPDRRRTGIGTAMIRHAARQAAMHGRAVLTGDARQGSAAEAFFRALGAAPGIVEVNRVLRLGGIPSGRLAALQTEAQAAAKGYSLLSWDGPVPQRYVTAYAALAEGMGDAPRDEGQEGQHWDGERVRLSEQRATEQGLRCYSVAAADERGELAAVTQLAVEPSRPDWGYQELTVVARPHRGHRLGLLVKLAMLDLLARREPELTTILTGNADTNKYMVSINEQLGFTELSRSQSWHLQAARTQTPS